MFDISGVGIFAAFLAGAVSFLSPCVLPLVPGYVSYIAGQPGLRATRQVGVRARAGALGLSACFVLGFSTVFIALGAGASAIGSLLLTWRIELNLLGGAIIVASTRSRYQTTIKLRSRSCLTYAPPRSRSTACPALPASAASSAR